MNLNIVRSIALIAGALMAVSIPLAATAQASTLAKTAPQRPATSAEGCTYFNAHLGDRYYEADRDRGLDWTARSGATSGSANVLEPVSGSLNTDCFHLEGGFGNGQVAFKLANSGLCLNIAGNSHAAGAWAILWPCLYPSNELFYENPDGLGDVGAQFKSASSGLCLDLNNGYNRGSILEQKNCVNADIYQSWFVDG
jgi:hypothetical protein